jgi:DNA-binding SARP family transcriptional activator
MDEERQAFALKLLGGASLDGPEGPLTGPVVQRQRTALLALLALSPHGRLSRDKLLAYLWPDADPERAGHALSNALDTIKRALGEGAVEAVGDDLELHREVLAVDVLELDDAIAAGELERAAAIYAGPFLDGIHVRDAPEFEQWVDDERERIDRAYGEVLERLAARAAEEGRHSDAVEWWRRRAALDPYDSRVAMAVMGALGAAGSRAEAVRHADLHASLLREERRTGPDPAVEKLAKALRPRRGTPGLNRAAIVTAAIAAGLILIALWLALIR